MTAITFQSFSNSNNFCNVKNNQNKAQLLSSTSSTTNSDEISSSNNGVTVHRSGIYLLKGSLMFTSVPSELLGNVKRIQIAVNGSVVGSSIAARLNAGEHIQIVQPRYLNAGDLVQLVVQCDNQTSSSYCVPAWWNLTVLGTL